MLSVTSREKLRECARTAEETCRENQGAFGEKTGKIAIRKKRSRKKAYLRFLISCFISRFRAVTKLGGKKENAKSNKETAS